GRLPARDPPAAHVLDLGGVQVRVVVELHGAPPPARTAPSPGCRCTPSASTLRHPRRHFASVAGPTPDRATSRPAAASRPAPPRGRGYALRLIHGTRAPDRAPKGGNGGRSAVREDRATRSGEPSGRSGPPPGPLTRPLSAPLPGALPGAASGASLSAPT